MEQSNFHQKLEGLNEEEIEQFFSSLEEENIESTKIQNIIHSLSSEEKEALTTPINSYKARKTKLIYPSAEISTDTPSDPPPSDIPRQIYFPILYLRDVMKQAYLHIDLEVNCFYYHSIYKYSAFVSKDKAGKEALTADNIEFIIRKDVPFYQRYVKSKKNTSEFIYVDKITGGIKTCGSTHFIVNVTYTAIVGLTLTVSDEIIYGDFQD